MKRIHRAAIFGAAVLAAPTASAGLSAQEPVPSFNVSGFIGATVFAQDQAFGFGNGQSALWSMPHAASSNGGVLGGDIRNTRVRLDLTGEGALGFRPSAVVEADFFGGFNGAGAFSDEQPLPRLRLAHIDLVRGRTTLRLGQAWTPIVGHIPVSTSRIAFPLGLGSAGLIGWRQPGIFLLHGFDAPAGLHAKAHVGVFRGSWEGPAADVLNHASAGEAGHPQVEGRLELSGTAASLYVAGHYDRKDLGGAGPDTEGLGTLTGTAIELGVRADAGAWTVHGNAYRGRAIGQQMGQGVQFGDIGSVGGWLQAGYRAGAGASVWAFLGIEDPSDDDALSEIAGNVRLRNVLAAVSLEYRLGDVTAGLEWIRADTRWGEAASQPWTTRSNQVALSMVYRFTTRRAPPVVAAGDGADDAASTKEGAS